MRITKTIFSESLTRMLNRPGKIIPCIIILVSGCLEPYTPETSQSQVDILVVDGFLDSSDGSATVRLTKASTLGTDGPAEAVQNASVSIEGDDGSSYTLAEDTAGVYVKTVLPVFTSAKYRVRVKMNGGAEYASDFVAVKPTPPIDSINWGFSEEGTTIYANAHDPSGNTRYYRWEYVETYEYTARIMSEYKLVDKVPVYREQDEFMYQCYRTNYSTKILANSTVQLEEDVVRNYPLVHIPVASKKLYRIYSLLVKQRAISKEEYTFLDQLRRTTEGIGSLFDPQPSQVPGNIHNLSDAKKIALGYFSVGNSVSKRIFIRYADLPQYLKQTILPQCPLDTICVFKDAFKNCSDMVDQLTGFETIGSALYGSNSIIGYTRTTPGCADCRLEGGVLEKPDFWP